MLFVQVCLGVCMRLSVIHSVEISNNSECFPVWPWIHFDNEAKIKIKTRESVRVILHKMHGENNNKPSSLETFHTKIENTTTDLLRINDDGVLLYFAAF